MNTPYTLIRDKEEVVGNEVQISNRSGWIPTFNGVVQEHLDRVIVDSYTIKIGNNSTSNKIVFGPNNNGYDSTNFHIKLIRPDTVENKKNIQITKKNDETYSQVVFIEYYHSSGIKLGEFTLTINNTRTERDLGTSTVKLDPRILQVNDDYSWIDLKNGDMLSFGDNNQVIGNYTDFIGVPSAFSNTNSNSSYNNFNLEKVLKINDSTAVATDAYTFNGKKYTVTTGKNEAAFPTNLTLQEFLKVDSNSKLVISKWDATHSDHKKNNKFLISGRSGNQTVAFTGNIEEMYLNKEGVEITSPTIDKTQYKFIGNGSLNLAPATVGTPYWFNNVKTTGETLQGNGSNREVVLKLGTGSDTLNAAGILPKSNSKRVANKMVLTVNSQNKQEVNLSADKLEKELTIGQGKVKIAIDNTGKLVVTKTQEGNIPSTPIEIKYYYKPSTNISTNEIHLGTFTLTVENPVVEIGTRNVKIDKRFVDKDGYNWLLGNNGAKSAVNATTASNAFSSLFKYEGAFTKLTNDTIERALKVENRPVRGTAPTSAEYLDFIVRTGAYHDEAAALNKGTINELTDKVIVSKYNGADSSLTNNGLLNNKFYILAKDSNDKYKIYTGNVTEEIVGNGVISGTGSVIFRAINNGKTYTFNPGAEGSTIATTDNTTMTITVNQGGKLLDGRGQSNIQSGNIANKITVSKDGNVSRAGNSATIDGITFGISSDGGLTISKSNSVSLTEDTTYTIKFYYSAESVDVELSTFNLTVKKTEAKDIGDIEVEVDPRLVKISSVDSGSVKWMSGDKMFGSWDTKEDYSNVIYTKNKITNAMTVNYVDTVVGKFRGTGTDYTVFKTAETGGYNIIAFKTGVALNNYLSEKNLMLSPADDQTFETIFEGTDGNKYKAEIILTHATGVSQEGYSGSGVLDISNGIKGTEYLFSAPTNTKTSTTNGLSMTVTDDFPNTNGVVTGKKGTSIADSVVVTVNGTTVTPENNTSVIGNKIYKVNNDLKVGLTSNNQIKIIKLARKFNYTSDNKIIIEYKYKDVKLGVFNLEINSDLTEVDLGTLEVKIDNRITQLSDAYSWMRLDGEVMSLDSGGIGNYKEFIQVGNWSQGANAVGYNANDKLKIVEKINNGEISYRSGIYARIQTENEAAFPEKETTSSNHILASSFIQTGQGTKLLVSKWRVSASEHNGENDFFVTGTKAGSEVEVAYKGNIQEKYRDKNGQESAKVTDISVSATRYNGNGSINLASAEIGTPYSFTKGGSGNIVSSPKVTNGRDSNSLLNLVVSNGEKNIDPTSMFNSSKKIANILKVSVNGGTADTVKGTIEGKLETGELTIGDGKIKIGIDTSGNLLITKTEEGNIPETVINITYYYSPDPNNDSKQKIELGTFDLTVENPVRDSSTNVIVKIDKRFMPYTGNYNWLFRDGRAMSDITNTNSSTSNKFSNFFTFDRELNNFEAGTIQRGIGVEGRTYHVNGFGNENYKSLHVNNNSEWKDQAAVPNKGELLNINDLVVVSKGNKDTNPNLENRFSLLYTATNDNKYKIYRGNLTEEIVGDGKTTGSGTLFFKAENDNNTYIFVPKATGSATGTSADGSELVITVDSNGKLPDGTGHPEIKNGKVANKITVTKNPSNSASNPVSSTGTSETVAIDNITFGISSDGGLTINKATAASLAQDTVYRIKFYYSANNVNIELSTFDLTIKKTTAEDKGDIIFTVDPRLKQITSVASGSVTWLTPSGMFGPWSGTKKDYSGLLYLNNGVTDGTIVTIDSVANREAGTPSSDYIVFENQSSYNDIAFKSGLALKQYGTSDNIMVSPHKAETFVSTFVNNTGNRYKVDVIVNYATGVSQDGYSGSGVLDISNGIKGTEYLFSAPTDMSAGSGTSTSSGGLSMTVKGNFPNTNGVVEGQEDISIADSVVVTVNGTTVTSERDSDVIGNQIYKVNNDLKVGLTSNNQIKVIKLSNEFDYKGTSAIEIKYKYKEVTLGSFILEISSKEVDAGSITFDVDSRLEQLSQTLGNYVTGNKTLGNNNHGNHNKIFSELIKVTPSYLNGAGELTNVTIDSVEDKEEISNGMAIGYIGFGKTEAGPAEIILKRNSGRLDYYGGNTKDTLISILNSETYIAKVKADTGKIYSLDFVLARNENAPKDGYTGTGSLSLAPAVLDKEYKFDPGLIAETTKDEITLKITGADSRSIDTRGLINSTDSIANLMEITVNNAEDPIRVVGTVGQAFEKTKIPVGEAEITLGIETNGGFKIVKTKEGNINNVPVRIDYYYSTNANDKSAAKVKLGTFNLTIDNPVVEVGTRNVKIDKRFADASVTTYSWLLGNNKAKVDVNGTNPVDFSSLFKYDSNAIFSNLTDDTIVKALRIDGRSDKVDQSGKYIAFRVGNSDRVNEAAVLNEGTIRNLNDEVIVSKNNGTNSNLNNKFYILAKDTTDRQTIYTGDVTEEIVGDGKTTGSGTLFFKAENDDNTYTFTPGATNTATGTSDDRTQLVITVNPDGKLPNGTGHAEIKTGKIANKITVNKNPSTGQNSTTSSRVTSESETVDNITFGISSNGGLTIRKASAASLTEDTTYTIKFYYSANSNAADDIELSTFDLTIKKTTAEEKGDITFNVDPRLTQITSIANGNVTWLNPNGMFGPWDNTSKKDYTKFLDLNNGVADNIQATIDSVVGREDGVLSDGYIVFKNKKAEPYNDIAFKPNLNLSQYGTLNNIMVSPYEATTFDSTFIDNDGNRYQVDVIVNHNDTVPKDGYSGSGSINMTTATLNTPYSFAAGGTGDVTSKPSGVTLKVATDKKSLDATGVVTSTDARIANFMTVQVGSETTQDVNLRDNKLETNILGDKIKVGINEAGGLTLTKLAEENIDPTQVVINYYYKPSNGNEQSKVKLGEFTLTIENPMITSNTDVTVEIDKRFENVTGYNWLFRDGKVSSDITSGTPAKVSGFEDFFTFSGDLDSQNGAIVKDLGMTNREVKNAGIEADYGYYHLTNKTGVEPWRGEGAVPRSGEMSQLNNLITVSKGNDPDDHRSLENEFSLLFADRANGDRYSIYRGKITEEIKGIGEYSGSGKIKEKDLTQNTKYIFSTKMTKMGTITSDNKDISIVEASGMPVNALGVVSGKTSKVVANKIRVEYKEENESGNITENTIESNGTLSVSYGGLTVGIDSTGGLTLQKTQEKTNITEVVINYLYEVSIGNEKKTVDLGEFTLTIEKDTITIDPDDAFLDFGKMFYDSRDGGETHETRVKKFKVINETGKEISFKVDKTAGEMTSSSNKLELRNISVKKDSNTEFTLQATAVLNKDTKPGSYEGTIEVIVDIITPSNP